VSLPLPAVQTVLGPVDSARLGRTLFHEHILLRDELVAAQFPHLSDPADLGTIVGAVAGVRAKGIATICDPTVAGLGRDIGLLRAVSHATGVHVIAATGLFTFAELPPYFACRTVDELADAFVHDLEVGVQGSAVRAAFLKCAIDKPGLTPAVEKVLRATARAHRRTGAPIMTHTHAASEGGLIQQDIFEDEGVDLARVVIGHCGDSTDLGYLERLAERGSYLGLDRYGMTEHLATDRRNTVLVELWQRGFGERLLVAQDSVTLRDRRRQPEMDDQRHDWHLSFLVDEVLPVLEAGLGAAAIETLLTDNVRGWLENRGSY